MYGAFFIVSFWLKKHNVSEAACASAIRQSMQLIFTAAIAAYTGLSKGQSSVHCILSHNHILLKPSNTTLVDINTSRQHVSTVYSHLQASK
jgi:hypothetical protein